MRFVPRVSRAHHLQPSRQLPAAHRLRQQGPSVNPALRLGLRVPLQTKDPHCGAEPITGHPGDPRSVPRLMRLHVVVVQGWPRHPGPAAAARPGAPDPVVAVLVKLLREKRFTIELGGPDTGVRHEMLFTTKRGVKVMTIIIITIIIIITPQMATALRQTRSVRGTRPAARALTPRSQGFWGKAPAH